ncbi:MAG: hypothetical protein HZC54_13090 [Verrucomicrobia bacterium]|nr:hypothetical protein [Verrucomicrobiota bacterium]
MRLLVHLLPVVISCLAIPAVVFIPNRAALGADAHQAQPADPKTGGIKLCEVHKTPMERKEAEVVFFLVRPGPDQPSSAIEMLLFPHRRESVHVSNVVESDPKTREVYVCAECKKAYEKWRAERKAAK